MTEHANTIVVKVSDGQRYPCPVIEVEGGSSAAAPRGSMTCAFTHEEVSLPSSSGWDLGLWAEV